MYIKGQIVALKRRPRYLHNVWGKKENKGVHASAQPNRGKYAKNQPPRVPNDVGFHFFDPLLGLSAPLSSGQFL